MGWFSKRKKQTPLPPPALIVLLDDLRPLEPKAAATALAAIEPLRLYPKFSKPEAEAKPGEPVPLGHVEFDSHRVRMEAMAAPVADAILDGSVRLTHWPVEQREAMAAHKAHLLLWHEGGGGTQKERFIALYKLAAVLGGDQLRGVIVPESWTAAPPQVVAEFRDAKFLADARESIPPFLFTGFVTSFDDEGAWFMTKGNHLLGVPDLVFKGGRELDPGEVLEILMNLLVYMMGGARIMAGHTAQITDEVYLRFSAIPNDHPNRDWLKGAKETLVVEKIEKDAINVKKK